MRKRTKWLVGVLALLAAGAVGADWVLGRTAAALLARVQASLPADATLTHGALSTSLFRMEVALDSVAYRSPQGSFTARRAVLHGFPLVSRDEIGLGSVELLDGDVSRAGAFAASVGHLLVENPHLRQPQTPDSPAGQTSGTSPALTFTRLVGTNFATRKDENGSFLRVGTFALDDLQPDRLARLSVTGVEGMAPDAQGVPTTLTLQSLTLDSFDLGLLRETSPSGIFLRLLLRDSLRGGHVAGLAVAQEGRPGFALRELAFDGQSVAGAARTALAVSMNGAAFGRRVLPPAVAAQLAAAGKEALEVDAQFNSRLAPEAHTLTLAPVRITLPGFVDVELGGVLGRVASADAMTNGLAMAGATLDRLDVRVRDLGGLTTYMEGQARAGGVDREAYAATLTDRWLAGAPVLMPVREGVLAFLRKGGEFRLTAQPASPVSLLQLFLSAGKPEVLAEKLGLSAVVTPAPAPQ